MASAIDRRKKIKNMLEEVVEPKMPTKITPNDAPSGMKPPTKTIKLTNTSKANPLKPLNPKSPAVTPLRGYSDVVKKFGPALGPKKLPPGLVKNPSKEAILRRFKKKKAL